MKKETESKLNELAVLEKNINFILSRKHAFRNELLELDSALEELESSKEAYSIIGSIMVLRDNSKIKLDLEKKKSFLNDNLEHLSVQESKLKDKAKSIQDVVMKELGD